MEEKRTNNKNPIMGDFVGFTPPSTSGNHSWDVHTQNQTPIQYSQYHVPSTPMNYNYEPQPQFQQPLCNFVNFERELYDQQPMNGVYNGIVRSGDDVYAAKYNLFMQQQTQRVDNVGQNVHQQQQVHTQLIENLVGNWVIPNTNGVYSPFGNNVASEISLEPVLSNREKVCEDLQFQFNNRDCKKPRVVAEVKPMRPSYSDVLLKSAPAPNVKLEKSELKESKQKKENKNKSSKKENLQKGNNSSRVSPKDTSNAPSNKLHNDKTKTPNKPNNLTRRWSSLDNVIAEEITPKGKSDGNGASKPTTTLKHPAKKPTRTNPDNSDADSTNSRSESFASVKNVPKKGLKRTKVESGHERPPIKRGQRVRKRECHVPFGVFRQKVRVYLMEWWQLVVRVGLWLVNLVSDICSLSIHLSKDMICSCCSWISHHGSISFTFTSTAAHLGVIPNLWKRFFRSKDSDTTKKPFIHSKLQNNITMPTTGEDAMKRLLACKGKDPYSILGVTSTCTDDDIKRYYKRQAFLVHPDKNQQPGAEEAFKILVHAFDMIGEPERRAAYDRGVAESAQVEQAWSELNDLLEQLQQKVEAAANTIRCSACNLRHKRVKMDRPMYAARNCSTCKIHHSAREGDIWAEARCCGFLWHYYACMEGGVYDITEWAGCQKESLKHLRPDSHNVQYRIALGRQSGQSRRQSNSPRGDKPPDLENLLNSLYGHGQSENGTQNARRKSKKNK